MADSHIQQLRRICLSLPEIEERLSHGHPAWFIGGKKTFVSYHHRHHDNRLALWCAAPPGAQEVLVGSDPQPGTQAGKDDQITLLVVGPAG